ncbi:MAG: amidohydrolase family protein, partial [Pseudomonadota bacterium]|nr:amidohydrolase family protein [Pseudomonadota bacterium]
ELALAAFAKQGITTFVDADSSAETIAAFNTVARTGHLTARAYVIPQIPVAVAAAPDARLAEIESMAARYDKGPLGVAPAIRLQSAKIYLDGVIAGPSFTGSMLQPYLIDAGSGAAPRWVPGPSRGPAPYFSPDALEHVVIELARHDLDPHMHVDGDRAVRAGLDAIAALRAAEPRRDIRPVLAHDEIVDPADYPRFRALNVTAVLSMQWEKPAADTIDNLRNELGPARFRRLEPAGFLTRAGARVVFGSDWPVDALDEWFALKVGITRTAAPDARPAYAGRLGADPGLTLEEALRAITVNAAYEIHAERDLGSIKVGKLADFIVLDRNVFHIPPADIAKVGVLETCVGGRTVYSRKY